MLGKGKRVLLATALVAVLAIGACPAKAGDTTKIKDGILMYLGVMPAEMMKTHQTVHTEKRMHGGPPQWGRHHHHVTIALFDAATLQRIEDADVEARVSSLGLSGVQDRLEPMRIAETVTYGNYFIFPGHDLYRISVTVKRPGRERPVEAEFTYKYERR